ncbi:MAG: hypothetical protein H6828_06365 [Planctomycetes bacterium]|nr:hypothetical protein [Planctomycetota bacterium]
MGTLAYDPAQLATRYGVMSDDELLAIVSVDARGYERSALALASAELRRRGLSPEELGGLTLAARSERDAGLIAERGDPTPLARWMWWFCFLESGTLSLVLLVWLGTKRRTEALNAGIFAVLFGIGVKVAAWWMLAAVMEASIPRG